jgi:hypothetical protein
MCNPRKKDYALIADILKHIKRRLNNAECSKMIIEVAVRELMVYPNFDMDKFIEGVLQ